MLCAHIIFLNKNEIIMCSTHECIDAISANNTKTLGTGILYNVYTGVRSGDASAVQMQFQRFRSCLILLYC